MNVWNLRLDLHPPIGAAAGERRAAAALLGAWLWDVLPAGHPGGLVEELDVDGAPVSLLVPDWLTGDEDPTAAAHACLDHLEEQIPGNPATAGWWVAATAEEVDPGAPSPADYDSPLMAMDDQTLADNVLAGAGHFTALSVQDLVGALDDVPDHGQDRELQLQAVAGALILAATWVADELLVDVATLTAGGQVTDTDQLCDLPPQFAAHYTPTFARRFLVAFLDLTARLTQDQWCATSCVAQDLGVRLLLNQADLIADLTGLRLPEGWQTAVAELLLEDFDHDYLYEPALDGFEDDPEFGPPGMASMRVQDWFDHIPGRPALPPYLA